MKFLFLLVTLISINKSFADLLVLYSGKSQYSGNVIEGKYTVNSESIDYAVVRGLEHLRSFKASGWIDTYRNGKKASTGVLDAKGTYNSEIIE